MYSTIYQISTNPIEKQDYMCVDSIVAGDMASISSVFENYHKERKTDIWNLVENILPKGMFTISSENILTYNGGFELWRKSYYDKIMTLSSQLSPENIMKWSGPIGRLNKTIHNPLETECLFVISFFSGAGTAERSADLMDLISSLTPGDKLYIGSILSYHN